MQNFTLIMSDELRGWLTDRAWESRMSLPRYISKVLNESPSPKKATCPPGANGSSYTMRMDEELYSVLTEEAQQAGVSMASYCRAILQEHRRG